MSEADIAGVFGVEGSGSANELHRAAVIAALLSSFTPVDAPLVRALTRLEIDAVRDGDAGCGDALLACCWLLFMIGEVGDAALIWEAKNVNFDAHCYVDSVLLVPSGVAATAEFARSQGLTDLADWIHGLVDPELGAQGWRTGSFFASVPPAEASAEELATWLRQ